MSRSKSRACVVVLLSSLLALAACGGKGVRTDPMLAGESFSADDTFSRRYAVPVEQACEAARRALLGQGYAVSSHSIGGVVASKNFQPAQESHSQIEVRVSCVERRDAGSEGSLMFISALQDRYALKKSPTSASLGVGALGSVSLPVGSSDDSLVRVASVTVQDAGFYGRFFERVQYYLPQDAAR